MEAAEPVRRVTATERVHGDQTPGMTRKRAIATDEMWASRADEAQMVSGWHHHGDHDTSIFVLRGALRMESGAGGSDVVDAGPGDFLHDPEGAVHREAPPTRARSRTVPRVRSVPAQARPGVVRP